MNCMPGTKNKWWREHRILVLDREFEHAPGVCRRSTTAATLCTVVQRKDDWAERMRMQPNFSSALGSMTGEYPHSWADDRVPGWLDMTQMSQAAGFVYVRTRASLVLPFDASNGSYSCAFPSEIMFGDLESIKRIWVRHSSDYGAQCYQLVLWSIINYFIYYG